MEPYEDSDSAGNWESGLRLGVRTGQGRSSQTDKSKNKNKTTAERMVRTSCHHREEVAENACTLHDAE